MGNQRAPSPARRAKALPPQLVANRSSLRSSASIRQFFDGNATPETAAEGKRIEPYIQFYGTTPSVPAPRVIPQGFGYIDAGKPAPDLNDLVSAGFVGPIADHIRKNLPLFEGRKGGFPAAEDYLKTLAASMIDYSDTDGNATVGTDAATGISYRGVDSYPFVNELFDRYEWTGGTSNTVKISVETYAELWNPSNQTATGVLFFKNQNKHGISVPPAGSQKFSDSGTYVKTGVSIPPNGFYVAKLGSKEYSFPASSTFPPSELIFTETKDSNFELRWNGKIIDIARGGLQRTDGNLRSGLSNCKWKGNSSPALDYSIGQAGDPRASYYINTWVYANSYDSNSNWGGRSLKRDIANPNYNEVRLADWADSGSDSDPGIHSGTNARIPTDSPDNRIILKSSGAAVAGKIYPVNQPDLAPAFISNAGRYNSLGELGNIFDPAQFTDVNSANPVANSSSGGGFSLAIGRPEFGAFDKDGQRSAQLLDLFSISPIASTTPLFGRRININTAPREVLRSLVAGVNLDTDPATPGVSLPTENETGDIFADFVMAQRAEFPLRGSSDLNNIRKNPRVTRNPATPADAPFFGSRDAYPMGDEPPKSWDDAGREELFRKTLDLVTFTSKSFRIVVAGETLDRNGRTVGRGTREFHYSIEPQRDPTTGNILTDTNGNPLIQITKHYEKTL
jgi:hypothetical protein